jgi:hypothetical protein
MTQEPAQKPAWVPSGRVRLERELAETLRQAAYVFEKEKDGRFLGPIAACRAVAHFIRRRDWGAELAGPFLQMATAFEVLEKGGKPRLFSKKTVPEKERERSPERKHVQRLAAAAPEVLVKLDDPVGTAANAVARHVNDWPGMSAQKVRGVTVIAWRKQKRRSGDPSFDLLVKETMAEPDPRGTIESLLRNGPPGLWQDG